ncbi:hypothetical protein [Dactylosporangium sp. CA-092794]|uniref:hypothetical protein n=1 Tax=Dactylosporangium sp. CA-092794 TaxID=3239929 RepID=UPI003D89F381
MNDGAQPDTSAPTEPAALDVITAFAPAWARPGLDQPRWYADVARYATPAYAAPLPTVDPATVPATTITTTPAVTSSTSGAVAADSGTDAGPITVTCIQLDGHWLVVEVEPSEPDPEATR